jgi:hypothetical protein
MDDIQAVLEQLAFLASHIGVAGTAAIFHESSNSRGMSAAALNGWFALGRAHRDNQCRTLLIAEVAPPVSSEPDCKASVRFLDFNCLGSYFFPRRAVAGPRTRANSDLSSDG